MCLWHPVDSDVDSRGVAISASQSLMAPAIIVRYILASGHAHATSAITIFSKTSRATQTNIPVSSEAVDAVAIVVAKVWVISGLIFQGP